MELTASQVEQFELIGEGQTAQVFRGSFAGKVVAVKQFTAGPVSMPPKELRNLTRELEIMRQLKHPRLVHLVGLVLRDLPLKIVMEFCSGGNLFNLLHDESSIELCWAQSKQIMLDIAVAVEYLHGFSPQIIHRDLKSLNMLLEEQVVDTHQIPRIKVSDFGLARVREEICVETLTKEVGTPHWMAPEVLTSNAYDTKVDVYSFAMMFYEVICLEIPYVDLDKKRLGLYVVSGGRPDEQLVPDDCPPEFVVLMRECWAHDPQQRPDFAMICEKLQSTFLGNKMEVNYGSSGASAPDHLEDFSTTDSTTDTFKDHDDSSPTGTGLGSGDD